VTHSRDIPKPPPTPEIDIGRCASNPVAAVSDLIERRRRWFQEAISLRCDAIEVARASSDVVDGAVSALLANAQEKGVCRDAVVMALGGYGRREMAPQSDVDLMFLVEEGCTEQARTITDHILYPFWDSGLDVTGVTRTLGDCTDVIATDVRALTSMLDARMLAGSSGLWGGFQRMIRDCFSKRSDRAGFLERKMKERAKRLKRYGASIYLAQPNVKESEGGLRDYHTLMWALKANMMDPEADGTMEPYAGGRRALELMRSSYSFLWRVRNALHVVDPSSKDRLAGHSQQELARLLGFSDAGDYTARQALMAEYYGRAASLHRACERALCMLRRELNPPSKLTSLVLRRRLPDGLVKTEYGTLAMGAPEDAVDAASVMRLFAAARVMGVPVDAVTKEALDLNQGWRGAQFGPAEYGIVREIFADVANLDRVLDEMQECGALAEVFPEMEGQFYSVQDAGFHTYTVGVHSIKTVGQLAELSSSRSKLPPAGALKLVRRPRVLALAAFLHDIGKGHGGAHESRGAEMARDIAGRLGLDGTDCADVEFLVRSHLLMSTLAFRRDIRDPSMVGRFAQSVRSQELLAMLYLLTYADLRAVGPGVWSDWKGGLLTELYQRTLAHMATGGMTPQKRKREVGRITSAVLGRIGSASDEGLLREFLLRMPERYLFSVSPDSIAAHFMMSRDLATRPVATLTRNVPQRGCTEFSVVTGDSPGLFAKIAGVLSANGANIVDAQLYTSRDGTAIDVLWVTDSLHRVMDDAERWSRIRLELAQAISGERELARIVGKRFVPRIMSRGRSRRPIEVTVDNDVSAMYTVLEISADDRRGLLYNLASTMHDLGLSIDVARIATHVDQVTDVFYIKDSFGRKLDSRERVEGLKAALVKALEE